MSVDSYGSSNDSNDSYHTIFDDSGKLSTTNGILKTKWEAVECTLYNEKDKNDVLNADIIHECHLWKESFPYLRINGSRIDTEINIKKAKLRKNIISTVVNQLVMKIAGEGLSISTDNGVHRPAAPKKESYFERGKQKQHDTSSNIELEKTPVVLNTPSLRTSSDIKQESSLKPLRSILKKSPKRVYTKRMEGSKQRHTNLTNVKTPSLPKINTGNNWLNRSERFSSSLPSKKHYSKKQIFRQEIVKERLILPPISPNL